MGTITFGENVIGDSIRELVEKIKSNIDLEQVRAVCKEQHGIETVENIDFENGDIDTYSGKIASKLDLKISFYLSILIDREGNCIHTTPENIAEVSKP